MGIFVTLPIEEAALEKVANNAELNIKHAKQTAQKELRNLAIREQWVKFSEEVDLVSYTSLRADWIATFVSWYHPDLFITIQYQSSRVYTRIDKMITRSAGQLDDPIPGL